MRALQDPTPERVRDLIENIVEGKIRDGQLDESPVTLREIRQIKEQFVKVLSGIHHHRIDYPQTRHLTESPDSRARAARAAEVEEEAGLRAEAASRDEAASRGEAAFRDEAASGAERDGAPETEAVPKVRGPAR
jgi:cyclic-di-AMP phosphodiesterase PgpH